MPTHEELVERAAAWLYRQGCSAVLTDRCAWDGERPDAIGWQAGRYSLLVEVKVSRSDFLTDKKKPWRQPGKGCGQRRWFMTSPGMVKPEEVPEGWGLLYVYPQQVRQVKKAPERRKMDMGILLREMPLLVGGLARLSWGLDPSVRANPALLERLEAMEERLAVEGVGLLGIHDETPLAGRF